MQNSTEKFLEFNEKKVYFISGDGTWYIAIKPICEALGVNYQAQHKAILKDEILGPASSVQTMQVVGDQARGWACLPEFFVYGWLMSIQSESKELKEYKWKCYELLYNFFHGSFKEGSVFLKAKTLAELEIEKYDAELMASSEIYRKMKERKNELRIARKQITKWHTEADNSQISLFENEIKDDKKGNS